MASATMIELDDRIKARIRQLADARKQTSHRIMQEAIEQYVEREEKREVLRVETLDAWQEFEETGLHATAEDVDRWLAGWGTENGPPPPKCRR